MLVFFFRYFFKKPCPEFESGVVHEEITCDADILPLWEGKVVCKVERIHWWLLSSALSLFLLLKSRDGAYSWHGICSWFSSCAGKLHRQLPTGSALMWMLEGEEHRSIIRPRCPSSLGSHLPCVVARRPLNWASPPVGLAICEIPPRQFVCVRILREERSWLLLLIMEHSVLCLNSCLRGFFVQERL